MRTHKQMADAYSKRLQRARDEVAKVMQLSKTTLTFCAEADQADLNLGTALNWIDAALIELGRIR